MHNIIYNWMVHNGSWSSFIPTLASSSYFSSAFIPFSSRTKPLLNSINCQQLTPLPEQPEFCPLPILKILVTFLTRINHSYSPMLKLKVLTWMSILHENWFRMWNSTTITYPFKEARVHGPTIILISL